MHQSERVAIYQHWYEFHYDVFPQEPIFSRGAVIRYGVTEEDYDDVRMGYAALMAGVELQDSAYRRGCLPTLLMLSLIGIPFLIYLQHREGMMRRRARNAAVFAFRAIADGDDRWPHYLMAKVRNQITTDYLRTVF